jgi:hypothetical protein
MNRTAYSLKISFALVKQYFETIPADDNACAKILKDPILGCLANTADLASPPYFDTDGNYIGRFGV